MIKGILGYPYVVNSKINLTLILNLLSVDMVFYSVADDFYVIIDYARGCSIDLCVIDNECIFITSHSAGIEAINEIIGKNG